MVVAGVAAIDIDFQWQKSQDSCSKQGKNHGKSNEEGVYRGGSDDHGGSKAAGGYPRNMGKQGDLSNPPARVRLLEFEINRLERPMEEIQSDGLCGSVISKSCMPGKEQQLKAEQICVPEGGHAHEATKGSVVELLV
ncbi:hypothetical protein COCNU_01G004140 [Cocos nucifera]|uniref:Uncharacterized protein n=1 Tax=Cocos nucifera TaxID=13894 RepID=A0A8K0HUM5_COCNU|nr:hypothetical protein COCNU_01G004140 [Cocos nucifera]